MSNGEGRGVRAAGTVADAAGPGGYGSGGPGSGAGAALSWFTGDVPAGLPAAGPTLSRPASASGARLALSAPPPIGTLVSLLIDRLEVFGTVVWAIDGQCGIGFDGLPGVGPLAVMRHLGERATRLAARDPLRGQDTSQDPASSR